ncbi:HAD family hydrolase [Nocardia takedensis]
MIRAVLLDVGGVLLLPGPELVGPALPVPAPPVDVLDCAHYRALAMAHQTAEPDWDIYFRVYAGACGVPSHLREAAVTDLRRVFGGQVWTRIVPGAREVLARLRSAGALIGLVSNADGHLEEHLRALEMCRVGVEVDAIVDSAVVGAAKPDPAVFALALELLGVPAADALHVGDTVRADVHGAWAAGVSALHYVPFGYCADSDSAHPHLRVLTGLPELIDRWEEDPVGGIGGAGPGPTDAP